jgi:ubiquinone/menaquinone biosynthesis C-methylase UbiE
MSLWGRVFAAGYDRFVARMEEGGLRDRRAALLADAAGEVLEIGGGTGANVPLYGDGVQLTVTEPEEPMAKRLEGKHPQVRVVRAPAESLPFDDASFDVAVSTLVLCTVGDQARALAELRRVLRPGGRLLFIEHVRSQDAGSARWQDRLTPLQRRVGHGCHPNRDTLAAIEAAGFEVGQLERGDLPAAPPFLRPMIAGAATAG